MGKILVYVFNQMTDYEINFISHILRTDAGKEIITFGDDSSDVRSSSGFIIKPEYKLSEVLNLDVEGLILCGGFLPQRNEELSELIQRLHKEEILIAAIGGVSTLHLAHAGILNEINYTTPIKKWDYEYQQSFGKNDPFPRHNHLNKKLVRDHHVITAQGAVFLDFTVEICAWFNLFQSKHEKHSFARLLKQA